MSEILIRAVDNRMPDVTEWRRQMTTYILPRAQAYLAEYPDVPEAVANWKRYQAFREASSDVELATVRPDRVKPEDLDKAVATVNEYLSAPVSDTALARARLLHAEEIPKGQTSRRYSIATVWKNYKYIIDVDSKKTDAEKAVEIEEKDRKLNKRGSPIEIAPLGTDWGPNVRMPTYALLKLPSAVPLDRVRRYLEADYVQDGFEDDGTTPRMVLYRKRKWRLLIDNMPLVARQKIVSQGYLSIGPTGDYTWTQVKNFLLNLRTGVTETEEL